MSSELRKVKLVNTDPSSVGLFGLALVTLVASSQKLGITSGTSYLIPWAFFLGGCAQLFACVEDAKRENLFGTTAFAAYGLFWVSMAFSWLIGAGVFGENLAAAADGKQLGFVFIGYLILSLFFTVVAAELNKVLFLIIFLINILFIGLAMGSFGVMPEFAHYLGAYTELAISMLGFYGCGATLLNNFFGRVILPTGKPLGITKR
ncbi:MAG: acetate uptake transporter [Clostridia bacterium]|nr:acetate uptake transporter [Clostridia bacterium]